MQGHHLHALANTHTEAWPYRGIPIKRHTHKEAYLEFSFFRCLYTSRQKPPYISCSAPLSTDTARWIAALPANPLSVPVLRHVHYRLHLFAMDACRCCWLLGGSTGGWGGTSFALEHMKLLILFCSPQDPCIESLWLQLPVTRHARVKVLLSSGPLLGVLLWITPQAHSFAREAMNLPPLL